jgi:hypothetical protein
MRKEIDWSKFLFRSSGLSNIMTGSIGLSEPQKRDLALFRENREKPNGLTDKQLEQLKDFHKVNSKTGRNYGWFNKDRYRSKRINSTSTRKVH